jgi:hypothetical protein
VREAREFPSHLPVVVFCHADPDVQVLFGDLSEKRIVRDIWRERQIAWSQDKQRVKQAIRETAPGDELKHAEVLEMINANSVKDDCRFDSGPWENLCFHTALHFHCSMVWFGEPFPNVIYEAERTVTYRTVFLVKVDGHRPFHSLSSPVCHWEHKSAQSASADLCVHPSGYPR